MRDSEIWGRTLFQAKNTRLASQANKETYTEKAVTGTSTPRRRVPRQCCSSTRSGSVQKKGTTRWPLTLSLRSRPRLATPFATKRWTIFRSRPVAFRRNSPRPRRIPSVSSRSAKRAPRTARSPARGKSARTARTRSRRSAPRASTTRSRTKCVLLRLEVCRVFRFSFSR